MSSFSPRVSGRRNTFNKYIVLCEGRKTEKLYFENYQSRTNNLIVKVMESPYKNAIGIIEYAQHLVEKHGLNMDEGDLIYCVFDRDSNTGDELLEAYDKATANDIQICLSNPCFEIWFLLHYEYIITRIEYPSIKDKLKKHMGRNYKKNSDVYPIILDKRNIAIENASKLVKYHKSQGTPLCSIECNPFTQVPGVISKLLK